MKSMFKGVALLVAVTCLVWVAVLWHWRSGARQVDATDMVVYLGFLPLVIFGLLLAGRWAVGSAIARQEARGTPNAISGGAAGDASASESAGSPNEVPRVKSWHVVGHWLHVPAGMEATELLEAVSEGEPRPAPDMALRDDEGLPVLTVRSSDLDLVSIVESTPAASEELQRTLACLAPMISQWIDHLRQWSDRFRPRDNEGKPKEASRVRVQVAWPAHWNEQDGEHAQRWLANELALQAGEEFGPDIWSLQSTRATGAEMIMAADRLLETLQKQGRDDLVLLVGCHSDLTDAGVRRLEREGRLFHGSRRPKGQMPGEGSASLLLSTKAWPLEEDDPLVNLVLTRPRVMRRDHSVDAAGRVTAREAQQCVKAAMQLGEIKSGDVKGLVSDADQHTSRATELFAVSLEDFPDLDPVEDMRLIGTLTGTLGSAAPLATLSSAIGWSADPERLPLVAMSLGDSYWRIASLLYKLPPSVEEAAPVSG
jgi:hypothetical protein